MPRDLGGRGAEGSGRRGSLVRAVRTSTRPAGSISIRTRGTRCTWESRTRLPTTTAAVKRRRARSRLYKGKVASTYFFSTSGGRTATFRTSTPGSPPVPYLVSVPDPYDSISPYHDWGPYRYSVADDRPQAQGARQAARRPHDVATPSGRVQSVVMTGAKGDVTATGPPFARPSACARPGSRSECWH